LSTEKKWNEKGLGAVGKQVGEKDLKAGCRRRGIEGIKILTGRDVGMAHLGCGKTKLKGVGRPS